MKGARPCLRVAVAGKSAMHALASLAEIVGDDEIRAQDSANMAKTDVEQQPRRCCVWWRIGMNTWRNAMRFPTKVNMMVGMMETKNGLRVRYGRSIRASFGRKHRSCDRHDRLRRRATDPQVKAFASLWKVLDKTCEAEHKLVLHEPQYVLDCAWRACGKAGNLAARSLGAFGGRPCRERPT